MKHEPPVPPPRILTVFGRRLRRIALSVRSGSSSRNSGSTIASSSDLLSILHDLSMAFPQRSVAYINVMRMPKADPENKMSESIAITVVGSGYVGLVAAACFAEIGHRVLCVDNDEAKVNELNQGVVPIHEEFLPELLGSHRASGQVQFTTDLRHATQESQAIFIAVGTPQSETGNADLSYVDSVASEIARSIHSYKVIVEKSTVPVYTNDWIRRTIERNGVLALALRRDFESRISARRHGGEGFSPSGQDCSRRRQ